MKKTMLSIMLLAACAAAPLHAADDEARLDVYSARGDTADEDLFRGFVESEHIQLDRTINTSAAILEALENEGEESPADVVLLNSAALLAEAQDKGLLKAVQSDALDQAVPENLRAAAEDDGGTAWFGFARRARIIVYDKDQVDTNDIDSYRKLADDSNKGKLCLAHDSDGSNLGLVAAMIEHEGAEDTETWLAGVKANLARAPSGNDGDQVRAVADGVCKIALATPADLVDLMKSDVDTDRELAKQVSVMFPNQASWGTWVDVQGAAVARHSKHPEEAVGFLEFLAGEQGQNLFANDNNSWPVVARFKFDNDELQSVADGSDGFKADETPLARVLSHVAQAREMVTAAGFEEAGED